jgi:2-keto-4-pentenoate hydratase/2-oxohepta-3-ene-1,7-dioic acid hydratase in catechol pathway
MQSVIVDGKLVTPSKVVCVGRNYAQHITELGNEIPDDMVVFIKPNSAISERLSAKHQESLHYEGELSFIYSQGKFSAVGFGLDLTKRELQNTLKAKGLPWDRAKAFDGAAVFSEFVSIEQISSDLRLELSINGKLVQSGGIALMMYKPDVILKEIQGFMSLEEGDIVMTGTPKGVGMIQQGDSFEAKVLDEQKQLLSAQWLAQ